MLLHISLSALFDMLNRGKGPVCLLELQVTLKKDFHLLGGEFHVYYSFEQFSENEKT